MDVRTMVICGKMLITGGLVTFTFAVYASIVFSIFIITEAIAAFLVLTWGICLLVKSRKMEDSFSETEYDDQSGRISPFYYELEPVHLKRDLPPIPRDIGREYDPVVLDKV